nr:MAG TPA: hypothetical protein [Caudoviricetes sp.]
MFSQFHFNIYFILKQYFLIKLKLVNNWLT